MSDADGRNPHFTISGFVVSEDYISPAGGPDRKPIPPRDRPSHGADLLGQIATLKTANQPVQSGPDASDEPEGLDLQIEFEGFPDIDLAFESLARERAGIELRNVRRDGDSVLATVFVPAGKLVHFERLIKDYLEGKRDKRDRPRDHQRLIDAIREIRLASVNALWTDDQSAFPDSKTDPIWWEVWLAARGEGSKIVNSFREQAKTQQLITAPGELRFPERTVLLVRASLEQLQSSVMMLNSIAELRRAKETADFFDSMEPDEQGQWLEALVARTGYAGTSDTAPHVCLLDTGVNRGNPLLGPALAEADLHSVEPGWGVTDDHGHGTRMAGLALCGDLTDLLISSDNIEVLHRLESVKLLPNDGANVGDARFHGYLTVEAVSRPEVTAPGRLRLFGMAITANDRRDRGRPSAWSAAVDRLASDSDHAGKDPRLMVVSAGNIDSADAWGDYPASNDTDSIQDPGQAWNALTIGAFTELADVSEEGNLKPIAPVGGLSPFSTTSLVWEPQWPLKPDVLFEGGNVGKDALGAVTTGSLSVLTTGHEPLTLPLATARATSAATALSARFGARLMAQYPSLWAETVRGLVVHSADWTTQMRSQYLPQQGAATKTDYLRMIRRCGFGVPDLDLALWSVRNSLTLIAQETITPFKREKGKDVTGRELHLHNLPWPKDLLESLGAAEVELRVTLSYFVEPNPSARGVRTRYSYQSHGFRFDLIRPEENLEKFRKRINLASREADEEAPDSPEDSGWLVGKNGRHRGSLHSDIWRGTAAALASRGVVAVYPSSGWWKTRPRLEQYNRSARYALIVSIRAPQIDVDLYAAVATEIAAKIAVQT